MNQTATFKMTEIKPTHFRSVLNELEEAGTTLAVDARFEQLLETIEADIHKRSNRMRHSMNGALIAIGCRNKSLRRKAETAAKRIGKVEVHHGETNCVTLDAIDYIARTWQRKERMAAKRTAPDGANLASKLC